jgi:hypothetical protein
VSAIQHTGRLSGVANGAPVLVTSTQAAGLLGRTDYRAILKRIEPDAWMAADGQTQALYLLGNVLALGEPGGALDATVVRRGRPRKGEEPRPVPGPEKLVVVERETEAGAA